MDARPTTSSPPSLSEPERLRLVAIGPGGDPIEPGSGLDGVAALARDGSARFWIDATDPGPETVDRLASLLGIHPLIAENVSDRPKRAKVTRVDGTLHLVVFAVRYAGEVSTSDVDFVLTDRFLLTVHDLGWDPAEVSQLRTGPERLLAQGPDYLLYVMADAIVDGYFPVLDRLADEIDGLQDDVVERTSSWTLERLFVLKRELIGLRRATTPAREIFNQLTNRELGLIRPEHVIYYRDVYDHLIRVTDDLDNYRELISGTLEVYLTSVNNNLSNIMKRLTGVTVILAGIGAVAGLFGMSEAGLAFSGGEASGFWAVLAATVLVAAIVAVVLRRIDWI